MERLLEFVINHPELVVPFFVLLTLLILLESRRGGKTVSSQQLVHLVNKEDAVVVDVRDAKEFREGHITESRNIPFSSLKDNLTQLDKFKEKPVILVCKMGQHAGAADAVGDEVRRVHRWFQGRASLKWRHHYVEGRWPAAGEGQVAWRMSCCTPHPGARTVCGPSSC